MLAEIIEPFLDKKVQVRLGSVDLLRADGLREVSDSPMSRSQVMRHALHLVYWAFVKCQGTELVVLRHGIEIGRMEWPKKEEKFGLLDRLRLIFSR